MRGGGRARGIAEENVKGSKEGNGKESGKGKGEGGKEDE
jgi:hypothetical protein